MRKLGMSAEEAENLEIVRELERFEILSACELFERENVSEKRVCQGASVRLSICLYAHFFRILLVSWSISLATYDIFAFSDSFSYYPTIFLRFSVSFFPLPRNSTVISSEWTRVSPPKSIENSKRKSDEWMRTKAHGLRCFTVTIWIKVIDFEIQLTIFWFLKISFKWIYTYRRKTQLIVSIIVLNLQNEMLKMLEPKGIFTIISLVAIDELNHKFKKKKKL